MRPEVVLTHEFVELLPDELKERTLYVSVKYKTVVHLCCCGCGREVVTPLSPASWQMTFDGASISLYPSIGSWNLPCQSHYWIDHNRARWSGKWSPAQVEAGRAAEARAKAAYYGESLDPAPKGPAVVSPSASRQEAADPRSGSGAGVLRWLKRRLFGG